MVKGLKICYLLESTELCGGVRVVFDQARALQKRGHLVHILAFFGDHEWYPYDVNVTYLKGTFDLPNQPYYDIVIATFWTTVEKALKMNVRTIFHLCQGYEGDTIEYANILQEIERVYRLPITKITIGQWLTDRLVSIYLKRYFDIFTVGQIVDCRLYRPKNIIKRSLLQKGRINILIVGAFEYSVKGIADAIKAVEIVRKKGYKIYLMRVSYTRLSKEEMAITEINEYHQKVSPIKMRELYHSAHIFVSPSLENEGFGLPFVEALACGVPSVVTAIPSYLSLDMKRDYALFVPQKSPLEIAKALEELINRPFKRLYLSIRGIRAVKNRFTSSVVGKRLEEIFLKHVENDRSEGGVNSM